MKVVLPIINFIRSNQNSKENSEFQGAKDVETLCSGTGYTFQILLLNIYFLHGKVSGRKHSSE
jgi:hypothetical protein